MISQYRNLALVTCGVAATLAFAMRPANAGRLELWGIMLAGYLCLGVWAVYILRKEGAIRDVIRVRSGDLTAGILTGLVVMGAGMFALRYIAPTTSSHGAWLFQLYAHAGDVQGESGRTILLLAVVVLEELVWRGFVQSRVRELWGARAAVPVTASLYALSHIPTMFSLAVADIGPNPLLVMAAFGYGLVWGFLTLFTGRLLPAVMCHAVVSYFLAAPTPAWLF